MKNRVQSARLLRISVSCWHVLLLHVAFVFQGTAQDRQIIRLWPQEVPGEHEAKHRAVVTDNKSRNVTRLTDVTDPVMEVFPASPDASPRGGVIVCPGGGYSILAIDLEGYEVARWLSGMGYTAFVLQYRVPRKREGALMDLQRAIRLVRNDGPKWGIERDRIGVIGFSAGGSLCARAATRYDDRTYPPVDGADDVGCRPDFAMLIYPAYLDKGVNDTLTPELQVTGNTTPMFLFGTADDKHANSVLVMGSALRKAGVPVEVHLLPHGGHGYGLRPGNRAAEAWPVLAESWVRALFADD